MTRSRAISGTLLFAALCVLAPGFDGTAAGNGRRTQTLVCVQYVCVPVYIDRPVYVYVDKGCPADDATAQKPGSGIRKAPGQTGDATEIRVEPKVHFLLVLDTLDPDIGPFVKGADKEITTLYTMLPTRNQGGLHRVDGKNLRASNVLKAMREMDPKPAKNDTVVVYCNVHGVGEAETKRGPDAGPPAQNLNMWSGLRDDVADEKADKVLKRADLFKALLDTDCRLMMLITDSCFGPDRGVEDIPELQVRDTNIPERDRAGGPATNPIRKKFTLDESDGPMREVLVKNLFLNHRGVLNMNSAQYGQFSLTTVFVESFVGLARGYFPPGRPPASTRVTWEQFVGEPTADRSLAGLVSRRFQDEYKFLKDQAGGKDKKRATEAKVVVGFLEEAKQTDQTVYVFDVDWKGKKGKFPTYSRYEDEQRQASEKDGEAIPGTVGVAPARGDTGPIAAEVAAPAAAAGPPVAVAPAAVRPAGPAPADVTVHIGQSVALYLDDSPTRQTAAVRRFQTPPLDPGQTVTYTLRAEGVVGGRPVVETREVTLRAGDTAVVRFDTLGGPAAR